MLRSPNPATTITATPSGRTVVRARVALALAAVLVLLLAAPAAQAAPTMDSSTAAASPARAWTVFDLGWWQQTVQTLFAGSGTETDEGAGLDPHGIDSPPGEPATSPTTDGSTPDGEEGVGLDPFG